MLSGCSDLTAALTNAPSNSRVEMGCFRSPSYFLTARKMYWKALQWTRVCIYIFSLETLWREWMVALFLFPIVCCIIEALALTRWCRSSAAACPLAWACLLVDWFSSLFVGRLIRFSSPMGTTDASISTPWQLATCRQIKLAFPRETLNVFLNQFECPFITGRVIIQRILSHAKGGVNPKGWKKNEKHFPSELSTISSEIQHRRYCTALCSSMCTYT